MTAGTKQWNDAQRKKKEDGYQLKILKAQICKFFEWEFKPDRKCQSRILTRKGDMTIQEFEKKLNCNNIVNCECDVINI